LGLVLTRDRGTQFLDLRSQRAAVTPVDLVSFGILPYTLFSGFMICHCFKIIDP
jgi:hypothetical protein